MDIEEMLRARLIEAIRRSFKRCPLIGEKWFRYYRKVDPPYFQFTGARKLGKATALEPKRVARRIVRNLDLAGVDCTVRVASDGKINIHLRNAGKSIEPPAG